MAAEKYTFLLHFYENLFSRFFEVSSYESEVQIMKSKKADLI